MSIGLTGAHRTGKSTLADAYSKESGVPFLRTSASSVFAAMGLDPKVDYPLDVRLDIQRRILESLDSQFAKQRDTFITDRTPIDLMAYTLADVTRNPIGEKAEIRVLEYLADCTKVVNSHFTTLIVVQPGIPLMDDEGKAPATPSYIEHIASLVMGLVVQETIAPAHYYIPREMLALEDRVRCIQTVVKRTLERHLGWVKANAEAGVPIIFH